MNFLQNLLVRGDAPPGENEESAAPQQSGESVQQLSQEELRRRRLARLENPGAAPSAAPAEDAPAATVPAQSSTVARGSPEEVSTTSPSGRQNASPTPISTTTKSSTEQEAKSPGVKARVQAVEVKVATEEAKKKEDASKAESPKKMIAKPEQSKTPTKPRDAVNDALVQLLRVSLAPPTLKGVTYLPIVAAEVGSTTLNDDSVDAALYGRLYTDINDLEPRPIESPLRYIMGCIERIPAVKRYSRADENPQVNASIENAKKLLINFVVTYLTEPGLFPSSCLAKSSTGPCNPEHEAIDLLKRQETSANFIHLLQLILPEVISQKCGKTIVKPILEKLSEEQRKNANETLENALAQLCCARIDKVGGWGQFVAELLADERAANDYTKPRSFFQPGSKGRRFEEMSILAPFFSAIKIEFEPGAQLNQGVVISKRKVMAARLGSLKQAVMEICRANETARDEMLKWFEQALELNSERSKDRPDQAKISTEAFAINVASVLLHLCEPFLSNEKSAGVLPLLVTEAIECIKTSRAFPSDVTILGKKEEEDGKADSKDKISSEERKTSKKKFKFQTRAFTLALRAVDLGPIVLYRVLGLMHRQLRFVRDDEDEEGPTYKRLLNMITTYVALGFEPTLVDHLLSFESLVSRWIMCLQLDLNGESPGWNDRTLDEEALSNMKLNSKLATLPEFVVGDIAEVFVQVGQHDPSNFDGQGQEKLRAVLDFFIFAISSGDSVVGQPHVRANMGDAIFYAFLPEEAKHHNQQGDRAPRIWTFRKGVKELVLESSLLSQRSLVPALMRLYGDVQVTGYYQVAAHRQLITKALGYLWTLEPHRPAFRTFAETSLRKDGAAEDSAFVKLANGILNQTNSNVAESLAKLREIRKTQIDMKNTKAWSELPEDIRNQRTVLLESNEKEVSACLMMANDATDMLAYLSTDPTFVKAFTVPALRSRLVDMLCNILSSLGSKKASEFKIDNPEKYNFYPKKMMEEVFQTLLNCAKVVQGGEEDAQQFVRTVANCAYYDYETFNNAAGLIRKHGIVNDAQSLDLFTKFVEDCEKAKKEVMAMEEELGEIPDEFLDPLMSTLMEDPVILPSSKITVDRSTIMHHLLQNSKDPFDRAPLDASMLKEDTDLKKRIMEWKSRAGKQ